MQIKESREITETERYIQDLRSFGAASHRLANLSRYADVASSAVLNGEVDPSALSPFVATVRSYYDLIRADILAASREEHRAHIAAGLREIPETSDVVVTALVLDQAIAWLNGEVMPSNFERQLRLSSMKMQMEETSIGEQLNRYGSQGAPGLYA